MTQILKNKGDVPVRKSSSKILQSWLGDSDEFKLRLNCFQTDNDTMSEP